MKLLIISAGFSPSTSVGAKRPRAIAYELAKIPEITPYVVTLPSACMTEIEDGFPLQEGGDVKVTRIPCRSPWHHCRGWRHGSAIARLFKKAGRVFTRRTESLCPIDSLYPWAMLATRRVSEIVKKEAIDCIWCTVPLMSNSLLAYRVSQRTNTPFVVDYRDLLDPDDQSKEMSKVRSLEAKMLSACAGITYVAPDQINSLHDAHAHLHGKPSCLIYNSFEQDVLEVALQTTKQKTPSPTTLIYGGSLYGGERRMDAVLEAIAQLNKDAKEKVVLDFYGRPHDQHHIQGLAHRLDVGSGLQVHSPLTQNAFEERCLNASVQLLVLGAGRKHLESIPAKLFDYLKARRPILIIAPKYCHAAEIVERTGCGIFAHDDNLPEIVAAIKSLQLGVTSNRQALDMSQEAVREFSHDHATKKLADFLASIPGTRGDV